jgi:hypothetical protein
MLVAQEVRALKEPVTRQNRFRARQRTEERGVIADAERQTIARRDLPAGKRPPAERAKDALDFSDKETFRWAVA